ncbi:MAG: hypothetical protein KDN20_26915, partial [Verrucomicrobiae bacterium]|nr:hypothetical protein [Verrucomicrobiae bacterium]
HVDSRTATTGPGPGTVSFITATKNAFEDRVRVTWQPASSAVQYRIFRATVLDFDSATMLGTTTATFWNDTLAVPGMTYYYFVTAIDDQGKEGYYDDSRDQFYSDGRRASSPLNGKSVPVRGKSDFEFSQDGNSIVVTSYHGFVERYSISSKRIAASYLTGGLPIGVDYDASQNFVFIGDSANGVYGNGRVVRVHLGTGAETSFSLGDDSGSGDRIRGNDTLVLPSGEVLVSEFFGGRIQGLNSGSGALRTLVDDDGFTSHFASTPDKRLVVLFDGGAFRTYDADSDTFGPVRQVSQASFRMGYTSVSRSGDLIATNGSDGWSDWEGVRVYSPEGNQLASLSLDARGVAFSPYLDELYVFVPATSEVVVYDTDTWQETGRISIGVAIASGLYSFEQGALRVSPNGKKLGISGENEIRLVDISDRFPPALPSIPTGLTATDDRNDGVQLSWSPATNAWSYSILRGTSLDPADAVEIANDLNGTSFFDSTASPGVPYHYWVKGVNPLGSSDVGNRAAGSVVVGPLIQNQPASQAIVIGSRLELMVTALAQEGGLSYAWYLGEAGDTSAPVGADSPVLTIDPILADGSYWVRVSDDAGSIDSQVAVIDAFFQVPGNVSASHGLFPDRIRITWQDVAGAQNYRVWRSSTGSFAGAVLLGEASEPVFEDTGAVGATDYTYFVMAIDGGDEESGLSQVGDFSSGRLADSVPDAGLVPIRDAVDAVFDEAGTTLYVLGSNGIVDAFEVGTGSWLRSFYLGGLPTAIDIDPLSQFLLVSDGRLNGGLGVVRKVALADGQVSEWTYAPTGSELGPGAIRSLAANLALVSGGSAGTGAIPLRSLNPSSGQFVVMNSTVIGAGLDPDASIVRSTTRSHALILDTSASTPSWIRYNTASRVFGLRKSLPSLPRWGAISEGGGIIAVSSGFEAQFLNQNGTLLHAWNEPALGLAFSPVLPYGFVADPLQDVV